jgi:hypothetical protein
MAIARRLRALATTAWVWGGMYAVAGAVFNLLQSYWGNPAPELALVVEQTRWVAFRWAVIGVISGGVFGALFSGLERRRHFADLKLRRVALWGVVGGMTLPLLNGALILAGVVPESAAVGTLIAHTAFGGMLGSACAAAWFSIARNGASTAAQRPELESGLGNSLPPGGILVEMQWSRGPARSSIPRT